MIMMLIDQRRINNLLENFMKIRHLIGGGNNWVSSNPETHRMRNENKTLLKIK